MAVLVVWREIDLSIISTLAATSSAGPSSSQLSKQSLNYFKIFIPKIIL